MNKINLLLGRRILTSTSFSNTFGYSSNIVQNSIQIYKEKGTKNTIANDLDVVGIVDVNISPININANVYVKEKKMQGVMIILNEPLKSAYTHN
jgi:hypothetical protein